MASPVDALLILCDAAVVDAGGKLHMLGAGWSVTTSPTPTASVAVMIKIPWDRTNQQIPCVLELVDADGHPVELEQPGVAKHALRIEQTIEAGRPPGVPEGTPIDVPFQVGLPPLPLTPGRYSWRLTVGDTIHQTSFLVRASPQR